jgi:phosphate transport system substrate-binding protein
VLLEIAVMPASLAKPGIALLFAAAALAGQAAAADALRVGGTGSSLGVLQQLGADFAKRDVTIDVIPGLGSSGAIHALQDGKLDLAVSARPLKADETAAGLRQVAVLRTAFVLATSRADSVALKRADLPGIFTAEKAIWPDGTPIRIILRPRSETDSALLGKISAGMNEAIEAARRRSEVPIAATDQDNTALAQRVPGSLAGTTMAQLATERPDLRIVRLEGLDPTLANVESGAYPFVKHLHFIVRSDGAPLRPFLDYMQSPQGLQSLRQAEIVPDGE